jgi:ZIP family zinc transporter
MGFFPFILGLIAFSATLSGGFVAIKYRSQHGAFSALAAGVLIAISFFHLLPEALDLAAELEIPVLNVMYFVAAGFVFLLILERYFSIVRVLEGQTYKNVRRQWGGWLGAGEISAHAFIEGLAIGLGFQIDVQTGVAVAVAIIAHDFCDGISAVSLMLNTRNTRKAAIQMLALAAAAPMLGIASTLFFVLPEQSLLYILPFLVGGFLYLGACDCLLDAFEKNPPWVTAAFSVLGFLVILFVIRTLQFH